VVIVLLLWLATQLADTGLFFYLTLILMKETQVNLFLKKKKYLLKDIYIYVYTHTHTHYNYLLWPFSLVFGWPQSLQVKWEALL